MGSDYSAVLPAAVEVVFRSRRCTGNPDNIVPQFYVKSTPIANITFTAQGVPDGLTGTNGTTQIFFSDAIALFGLVANPTNQAALDALAAQIANDFYNWRTRAFDRVYNGVIAPDMCGLIDEVEWRYDAIPLTDPTAVDGEAIHRENPDGIVTGVTTRMRSGAWNDTPNQLHHLDPAQAGCTDANNANKPVTYTPFVESLGPPGTCTGTGAAATATIVGGQITGYVVTNGGNCTGVPTVVIVGDGTGATANATVVGAVVTAINPVALGNGYTWAIVSLKDGGGSPQLCLYRDGIEDGRLARKFIAYVTIS